MSPDTDGQRAGGRRWRKEVYRLPKRHHWQAKPGQNVLVLDRGAVRFEYPEDWTVKPGDDSIRLHERETEEASDCLLQVSVHRLLRGLQWNQLDLEEMIRTVMDGDQRGVVWDPDQVEEQRPDFDLVWVQGRFFDPNEEREAVSRACVARRADVMALITMDFWPETRERFDPVWREVLETLRLGEEVDLTGRPRPSSSDHP